MEILKKFKKLNEPSLVEIEKPNRVVVIGDTHGDLAASQKVIKSFLDNSSTLIFLGDYVDRGNHSKENIDFLLQQKIKHPNQIYLLQGNHEGYPFFKFSPVNFWNNLRKGEFSFYKKIFKQLPLAATFKDIITLHGALPDLNNLEKINEITLGDKHWKSITWGDFSAQPRSSSLFAGRPQFSKRYFKQKMEDFNKKFLIRAHQPNCPQKMFNERCFTIFTSSAYNREKTVALISAKDKITKDNITLEKL